MEKQLYSKEFYNKEMVNEMLKSVHLKLDEHTVQNTEIITQVKKTNGRVTKLERNLLVVAVVVATLLFTNGSELISFVMQII